MENPRLSTITHNSFQILSAFVLCLSLETSQSLPDRASEHVEARELNTAGAQLGPAAHHCTPIPVVIVVAEVSRPRGGPFGP